MLNRWAVRMMGALLVLALLAVLWSMKNTLEHLQQQQQSGQSSPR
ncbi:MAG TPA: hypothetical protein VF215_03425 [Thermoanaerobaculia bacterium]